MAEAVRFCMACGNPLTPGALFCGSCGRTAGDSPAAEEPTPSPGPEPPGAKVGPPPPVTASPGGQSSARLRRQRLVATAIVLALCAGVAGVAIAVSGNKEAAAGEIFLDPNGGNGRNPFTPSVVDSGFTVPTSLPAAPNAPTFPTSVTSPTSAITSYSGGTPGLYGGTQQLSVCDKNQLISFLQATPDKAAAFAQVADIPVTAIPSYINGLTEVILRADTRVTNHGFANGRATPVQSVLQAGSAVLVDAFGVPRVRCFCGNPLKEPTPLSAPVYTGPKWTTFQPNTVTVVVPAPQPVTVIIVVDVRTGQPFARPVGTNGSLDKPTTIPAPSTTTTKPGSTTTTKPGTTTTAGKGSAAAISIIKSAFNDCVAKLRQDPQFQVDDAAIAALRYDVTAASSANVYNVRVTSGTTGEFGTWEVDVSTRAVTPIDQTAISVGALCSELA